MAEDWIKMRTDLYRDPKVIVMADHLMASDSTLSRHVNQMRQRDMSVTRNVTRCAVVGGLVSVWGVLRHQGTRVGDDLLVPDCTDAILDDISDLPGFGEAMASVGWAIETEDGLVLPRFFSDLNAQPIRSTGAERQKKYRERKRKGDVTRDVTRDSHCDVTPGVTVTGEKRERREEKRKKEPTVPSSGEKPEHPHKLLFAAVAEVTGYDPVTAKTLIGSVASTLGKADPPYSPEEVREFARQFVVLCPYAAKDGRTRPEPKELQTHIGKVRNAAPPPTAKPQPKTKAERDAAYWGQQAQQAFAALDPETHTGGHL